MPESGAGTAAQSEERRSQNGSDPRQPRAGGFGRPSLLRRFFEEIQDRLTADLDDRDPDFIRQFENQGKSAPITEGSNGSIELRVIKGP